jgi:hypothetical protein
METNKTKMARIWFVLALSVLFLVPQDLFSQGPPPWAPAHGYRAKTRHIYFPEHNMYFDLQKRVYIFNRNGGWSISTNVPSIYAQVNFGRTRQVELDFYQDRPYRYNNVHVVKYKGKKPHHAKKHKGQSHNQGKGKPGNKGKGKGK